MNKGTHIVVAALTLGQINALALADGPQTSAPTELSGLAAIRAEARAAVKLVQTELARSFLAAADDLSPPTPRTIYRDQKRKYITAAQFAALPAGEQKDLSPIEVTEDLYYTTKYGTPLAYVRPLEILGREGVKSFARTRTLDFGYGGIGPPRLFALLGADAVGVDVDPLLPVLYSQSEDQGPVRDRDGKIAGRVTLLHGHWPGDEKVRKAAGNGFDLILSKNTLKNGYLHPERPVDKRMLVDLGVSEEEFVKALFDSLRPGGHVMIYNISPAPAPPDKPYIPWADGRCPFPRKMLEAAGFRVLKFDEDDSKAVREMARAFGWDTGEHPMDLENDLFAHYTLLLGK
ncbi:MAG TPA: hypothetical protein VJZ71_17360 [Phycisphaerae bacterium]|nr:hypothetical protein [Phycisphaerae bacterium]